MGNLDLDTLLNLSIQQHLLCTILYLSPILIFLLTDSIMGGGGIAAPVIIALVAKRGKKYIPFGRKKLFCMSLASRLQSWFCQANPYGFGRANERLCVASTIHSLVNGKIK